MGGLVMAFIFPTNQHVCLLFRNWMDFSLPTTNREYNSYLLFYLHMQQLCCFISAQELPAFALLVLSSVPLQGEGLGGCLDAGQLTHGT